MSPRRTLTVSITPELDDLIRACLRSGRYSSTSEVVRAALRLLETKEARARRMCAGAADGDDHRG